MYSVAGYGQMISDAVRMKAYTAALAMAVKPGAVVVDIGTGTGIFAMLACRRGARKVFAIEPGDAIHVAREIAAANGLASSIEFIQAKSTEVELPERADVIVSDLRGVLPLHQHHLPAIVDARRRMLAPGGALIPQRDSLWASCVEAAKSYQLIATPWLENEYALDMRAALPLVSNQWSNATAGAEQMVTQPGLLGTIDYLTVDDPGFVGRTDLVATRAATAHGLCVWFDATLAEGMHFSNAPGEPDTVYGRAYFPWPHPLELRAGDQVSVALKANLVGDDYLWRWETRVEGKAAFDQSSFFAEPLSPSRLRKTAADFVPSLNEDGVIDQVSLGLMNEGKSLGDIARLLADRFPRRFASVHEALSHVGEMSAKYSR